MGVWTAKAADVECGAELHVIKALRPVYQMGRPGNERYRCEGHAPEHAPVDWAAVDAAKHAIEAAEAARNTTEAIAFKGGAPVLPGFSTIAAPEHPQLALEPRSVRLPAPRPPLPFFAVADSLPASSDHD